MRRRIYRAGSGGKFDGKRACGHGDRRGCPGDAKCLWPRNGGFCKEKAESGRYAYPDIHGAKRHRRGEKGRKSRDESGNTRGWACDPCDWSASGNSLFGRQRHRDV